MFQVNSWIAICSPRSGVILSAAYYALWLYRRVIFGALEKENLKALHRPVNRREKIAILYHAWLVILIIFFGVYPHAGSST